MKTVQSVTDVTIKVKDTELLEGRWLHFQLLSKKLGDMEQERNESYKQLRNKFYNSSACGKYNTSEIAGLKCIDIDNPMKGNASLVLSFTKED